MWGDNSASSLSEVLGVGGGLISNLSKIHFEIGGG